jgi:hypothetical protein
MRMSLDADRTPDERRRRARGACEDLPVTVLLEDGHRRFHVMAYHDAIQHDGPALELAELVNDEVDPALVTVLFTDGGSFGDAEVLLTSGSLPLKILSAFMDEVVREERRLKEARPLRAQGDDAVSLSVPAYDPAMGVVAPTEGGTATVEIVDGSVEILGDPAALRDLARMCLALSHPRAPDGAHIHLDAGINPLDLGSASLMLARHTSPPKP